MMPFSKFSRLFLSLFVSIHLLAPIAQAGDVDSTKGLLKNANAANNKAAFDTILKMALDTWPTKKERLLNAAIAVNPEWVSANNLQELDMIKKAKAEAEAASRARGIIYYLDPVLWNTKIELGAGSSTGDTDEKAVAAGMSFHRKFGTKWEHDLNLNFDYASSEGDATRQQFETQYEALWYAWDDLFMVNYTELSLDRFSGYDYQLLENIGLGYKVFETERHTLRLEAGPGVRFSKVKAIEATDTTPFMPSVMDTEYLGRLSANYKLQISESMVFQDKISTTVGEETTTFANRAEFSAKLNSHLTGKVSLDIGYDSNPPVGTSAWDTATRITLVYGF
ncbi:DUF481 domain-containing protein [Kordiimonas pumila]|uniref:YdiY family protein n=2 Tax=Kordiimonas pumila TaxID=2161677 RepID=A0ABV7D516_9PROT